MNFQEVIGRLTRGFHEHKVRYGLMGGFALGLWGVPRSTVDLDFLVNREDLTKVDALMAEMGFERRYRSENVSQYLSPLKVFGEVDFIHAFRQMSMEMLGRATEKAVFDGAMKVRVLIPEDIIGLKLQAIANDSSRRETDLADIRSLAHAQTLDWALIKRYAVELGVEDILKEVPRS